jgi:hypothetical protein
MEVVFEIPLLSKMELGILLKNANPYGICTEYYTTFFIEYSWCFDRLEFCSKFVRQVDWQSTEFFFGSSPPIQFLFPHFWLDLFIFKKLCELYKTKPPPLKPFLSSQDS